MKIAFFGTGEFSKNVLEKILKDSSIEVGLVVSQPDKPVGRKKIITPTPIKILAKEKGIKILQPEKLRDNTDFFKELKGFDFIVVVAYGKIVPNEVLEAPKHGCINIHGSILPKYRGASPIQEAIKNGDKTTGLTIMYMSEGMDEGDMLAVGQVNIDESDKSEDIFKKFEKIGPKLLINTLELIIEGKIKGIKQNKNDATYCKKIIKEDGKINFSIDNGIDIYNKFRAYSTWPTIFTYYKGKKFSIENCSFEQGDFIIDEGLNYGNVLFLGNAKNKEVGIITKGGILKLKQIKLEGKKSMDILSFINGNKTFLEYRF